MVLELGLALGFQFGVILASVVDFGLVLGVYYGVWLVLGLVRELALGVHLRFDVVVALVWSLALGVCIGYGVVVGLASKLVVGLGLELAFGTLGWGTFVFEFGVLGLQFGVVLAFVFGLVVWDRSCVAVRFRRPPPLPSS